MSKIKNMAEEDRFRRRGEIVEIVLDTINNLDQTIYICVSPQKNLDFWEFYHLFLDIGFYNKIRILEDFLKYEIDGKKVDCKELIDNLKSVNQTNNHMKHSEILISKENLAVSSRTTLKPYSDKLDEKHIVNNRKFPEIKDEKLEDNLMPELISPTISITDELVDDVKQKSVLIKIQLDKIITRYSKL